jgi:hypothetical protein
MISRSVRDRSASTRSTARNVNAENVSLLRSNADCMAGERTRSRNRITVVASGRLWVDARFCHSKRCAILIASIITRSELMGALCAWSMTHLLLKRAALSRPSGKWDDDDFDVLAGDEVVGRIYKTNAAPVDSNYVPPPSENLHVLSPRLGLTRVPLPLLSRLALGKIAELSRPRRHPKAFGTTSNLLANAAPVDSNYVPPPRQKTFMSFPLGLA